MINYYSFLFLAEPLDIFRENLFLILKIIINLELISFIKNIIFKDRKMLALYYSII